MLSCLVAFLSSKPFFGVYCTRSFDFMLYKMLCDIDPAQHLTWSLMIVLRSFVPVNSHWKKASSSSGALSLSRVIGPWNIVSLDYLKLRETLRNMVVAFFQWIKLRLCSLCYVVFVTALFSFLLHMRVFSLVYCLLYSAGTQCF